jgi:hypothetical protein
VPFRERAARARLQIALEPSGFAFSREFNRDHDRPRPMFPCEPGWTRIVPLQSFVDVAGDPDIVSCGVGLAPKDVHEPPSDSSHAPRPRRMRSRHAKPFFLGNTESLDRRTQFLHSGSQLLLTVREVRLRSPGSLASFPIQTSLFCGLAS